MNEKTKATWMFMIAVFALFATSAYAGLILSDDFNAADGTDLNTTSPDIGTGANWIADSGQVVINGGVVGLVAPNNTESAFAALPVYSGTQIQISADIYAGNPADYMIFGFVTNTIALLNAVDVEASCRINGDGSQISLVVAGNSIATYTTEYSWNAGTVNSVAMLLDTDASTATLIVNGLSLTSVVYTGTPDLTVLAAFTMRKNSTGATIDNFQVALIPEPAAISLLGCGFIIALFYRRLRA